jgi:hypothetical protein
MSYDVRQNLLDNNHKHKFPWKPRIHENDDYEPPTLEGGDLNYNDIRAGKRTMTRASEPPTLEGGNRKSQENSWNSYLTNEDLQQHIATFYEPRTCWEKICAFIQNSIEIWEVIFLYLLAFQYPSGVSLCFLVLSHILLISATYKVETRLSAAIYTNMAGLVLIVTCVLMKLPQLADDEMEYETEHDRDLS